MALFCEKKMSNEKQIEQEIQDKGLNAPRLTPDHIDSVIQSVHYFTAGDGYAGALASSEEFNSLPEGERFINPPQQLDLLTFCVIVLKNVSLLLASLLVQVLKTSMLKLVRRLRTKMHVIKSGSLKVIY